jgi:hypothetical protein
MSPTESSARKNVKLEPFFEDREASTFTTEVDEEKRFRESLLNSDMVAVSPQKNSFGYLTTEKIKQYAGSAQGKRSKSPQGEFYITKTETYGIGGRKGNMTTTNAKGKAGIIEITKETVTSYSPSASKMSIVHDHISHHRKGC